MEKYKILDFDKNLKREISAGETVTKQLNKIFVENSNSDVIISPMIIDSESETPSWAIMEKIDGKLKITHRLNLLLEE